MKNSCKGNGNIFELFLHFGKFKIKEIVNINLAKTKLLIVKFHQVVNRAFPFPLRSGA